MRADIDLREFVGSDVLDQGHRPTCVSFASSTTHEALQEPTQAAEHFAPEALWWQATLAGHTSADGMVLNCAGPALAQHGQPSLTSWPYNPSLGAGTEDPPVGVAPPWRRAQLRSVRLLHDGIEDPLEGELARFRPVILIIELTYEFSFPGDGGIVKVPDVRVGAGGYHAVTCVGAATHPALGRLLLVKNSWGIEWGIGGYCWLPTGYLTGFAVQAAIVDYLVEE